MLLSETQEPTFRLKSFTTASKQFVRSDAQVQLKELKREIHDVEAGPYVKSSRVQVVIRHAIEDEHPDEECCSAACI